MCLYPAETLHERIVPQWPETQLLSVKLILPLNAVRSVVVSGWPCGHNLLCHLHIHDSDLQGFLIIQQTLWNTFFFPPTEPIWYSCFDIYICSVNKASTCSAIFYPTLYNTVLWRAVSNTHKGKAGNVSWSRHQSVTELILHSHMGTFRVSDHLKRAHSWTVERNRSTLRKTQADTGRRCKQKFPCSVLIKMAAV